MSYYKFHCSGHNNILGTHKTTLEFTKDKELSLRGDCIIGVNSDFSPESIIGKFGGRLFITLSVEGIKDSLTADYNPRFSSGHEIVIRMGTYDSDRTLGVNSSKGSIMIDRGIIEKLKNPDARLTIEISDEKEATEQV